MACCGNAFAFLLRHVALCSLHPWHIPCMAIFRNSCGRRIRKAEARLVMRGDAKKQTSRTRWCGGISASKGVASKGSFVCPRSTVFRKPDGPKGFGFVMASKHNAVTRQLDCPRCEAIPSHPRCYTDLIPSPIIHLYTASLHIPVYGQLGPLYYPACI